VDFTRHFLRAQVGGGERGRREQELGIRIDRGPIFFLRPGQERIVGAQACLDMRNGDAHLKTSQRRAQRARRVALHDQQVGSRLQQRPQGA
jgi:hypothetical protein